MQGIHRKYLYVSFPGPSVEILDWTCYHHLCQIIFPTRIFYMLVLDFATDCLRGVWCRGSATIPGMDIRYPLSKESDSPPFNLWRYAIHAMLVCNRDRRKWPHSNNGAQVSAICKTFWQHFDHFNMLWVLNVFRNVEVVKMKYLFFKLWHFECI